jgi:hypothetical protein
MSSTVTNPRAVRGTGLTAYNTYQTGRMRQSYSCTNAYAPLAVWSRKPGSNRRHLLGRQRRSRYAIPTMGRGPEEPLRVTQHPVGDGIPPSCAPPCSPLRPRTQSEVLDHSPRSKRVGDQSPKAYGGGYLGAPNQRYPSGCGGRTRTCIVAVNSRLPYH